MDQAKLPLCYDNFVEIVTHDKCADGAASAAILATAYPDVRVTFMQYNTEEHRTLHKRAHLGPILFCDFSPHPDNAAQFAQGGHVCLDHHKTAKGLVELFGERGVYAEDRSGALLALEFVAPLLPLSYYERAKRLAKTASVYDLWQKQDPLWLTACYQSEALRFFSHETWRSYVRGLVEYEQLLQVGQQLHQNQVRRAQELAAQARYYTLDEGVHLAVVPASDINLVTDLTQAEVTAGFRWAEEGSKLFIVSLRVRGGREDIDVSTLARMFGGGGHKKAAGFAVPAESVACPFGFVRDACSAQWLVP